MLKNFALTLFILLPIVTLSKVSNDNCKNALTIDTLNGEIIRGDTSNATSENTGCEEDRGSPGVWYKIEVQTPMIIDVSTCHKGTTYDSKISIFSGTCNKLQCTAFNFVGKGAKCGNLASKVSFLATESTTYYVLVFGSTFMDSGKFELSVVANLNFFSLIDSKTDKKLEVINDGDFFSYLGLPLALNIQTSFDESVKSALVTFDNPRRSFCEKNAPFAVFGNNKTDFFGASIPVGQHTVTATPYSKTKCEGPAGTKISKSFGIGPCEYFFQYYDFSVNSVPKNFDGKPIPACKINIVMRAQCRFAINFVEFKIRAIATNRIVHTKKELEAPYYVFGNRGDSINRGSLAPGDYTIESFIDGVQHPALTFSTFDNGRCN